MQRESDHDFEILQPVRASQLQQVLAALYQVAVVVSDGVRLQERRD